MRRAAAILACALVSGAALAADTGWLSPSNEYRSSATDPEYAYSSNNERATIELETVLCLHAFGAAIPDGSTIDGIEVAVEGKGLDAPPVAVAGPEKECASPASAKEYELGIVVDVTVVHGASDDLWSDIWSASDINSTDFGVFVNNLATNEYPVLIDHVKVKIYYTPPSVRTRRMF